MRLQSSSRRVVATKRRNGGVGSWSVRSRFVTPAPVRSDVTCHRRRTRAAVVRGLGERQPKRAVDAAGKAAADVVAVQEPRVTMRLVPGIEVIRAGEGAHARRV